MLFHVTAGKTDPTLEEQLAPDQALLFTALREEMNAKIGSVKAWGIAALVGGQAVAGALAAYVGPSHAYHATAGAVARLIL
jgi:hypothetical protein